MNDFATSRAKCPPSSKAAARAEAIQIWSPRLDKLFPLLPESGRDFVPRIWARNRARIPATPILLYLGRRNPGSISCPESGRDLVPGIWQHKTFLVAQIGSIEGRFGLAPGLVGVGHWGGRVASEGSIGKGALKPTTCAGGRRLAMICGTVCRGLLIVGWRRFAWRSRGALMGQWPGTGQFVASVASERLGRFGEAGQYGWGDLEHEGAR